MMLKAVVVLGVCLQACLANVEKAIFLGPSAIKIPHKSPTIEDLHIDILTPEHSTLRTHIEAEFPTEQSRQGKASWYLLDHLEENRRYEVRICWAATQPTEFRLDTYELLTVWTDPALYSPLAEYSWARGQANRSPDAETVPKPPRQEGEREASVLFLRIFAAADYFTTNETLMSSVPPVYVDIILDPFVLNVLPRSLLFTAGYIAVVAIISFFAAAFVVSWIRGLGGAGRTTSKEKKER